MESGHSTNTKRKRTNPAKDTSKKAKSTSNPTSIAVEYDLLKDSPDMKILEGLLNQEKKAF